jgi:regulator of protease activity HflC (stomatin/prohibitin superfamily)
VPPGEAGKGSAGVRIVLDKLIDLFVASLRLMQFWTVVQPYEQAVRMRLGHYHSVLEPGCHWKLPFNMDYVHKEHVIPRTERLTGLATTTADGKAIGFDAVVTYRIEDIKKATLEVEDVRDSITDACSGVIGTLLAGATWADVLSGTALETVTRECRKRGRRWGIEVLAVQLTGVCLVRNLRIALNGQPHHNSGL